MKGVAIGGAVLAGLAALVMVLGLVSGTGAQRQARLQAASTACTTVLGIPATAESTVSDLGGPQAVTVLGNTATGARAADLLATLYRISNWRDLDPTLVAQWLYGHPDGSLPDRAIVNPFAPEPPAVQPDSYRAVSGRDDYEDRCSSILAELTPEQVSRATTPPRTDTNPSAEGLRAADAAESLIGQHTAPSAFLEHVLAAAFPNSPIPSPVPLQALWWGYRVAPASAARGDLVLFDYTPAGPTQIAITLSSTAVAATTGLDSPADPPGTVVTGHTPPGNVAIIRLASPSPATFSTERPSTP